jgi:hypothetical protein
VIWFPLCSELLCCRKPHPTAKMFPPRCEPGPRRSQFALCPELQALPVSGAGARDKSRTVAEKLAGQEVSSASPVQREAQRFREGFQILYGLEARIFRAPRRKPDIYIARASDGVRGILE